MLSLSLSLSSGNFFLGDARTDAQKSSKTTVASEKRQLFRMTACR
jgi:hypothetical protein